MAQPLPTCGKVCLSERLARARAVGHAHQARAYYCDVCRAWHITSRVKPIDYRTRFKGPTA